MLNKKNLKLPYIIAEIGSNNNGSISLAKKLIYSAKIAGCDAVKFQSWNENLYNLNNLKIKQIKKIKKLVMDYKKLKILRSYAKKIKIDFGTSVFDKRQINDAIKLKCNFIKIASMDCNNYPLIKLISKIKKPVIISTGFTNLLELRKTIRIINKSKKKNIYFLHCISIYPPRMDQLNLNNIKFLEKFSKKDVGFSDHSMGTLASSLACAVGAKIIEKHFTFNIKAKGADHKISSDFREMKKLVNDCKNVKSVLGQFKRIISREELYISKKMRRSIFASKNIRKGQRFSSNNICIHRPGNGLQPEFLQKIVNRKAKKFITKGSLINLKMF